MPTRSENERITRKVVEYHHQISKSMETKMSEKWGHDQIGGCSEYHQNSGGCFIYIYK